jgi:hypothetical protein
MSVSPRLPAGMEQLFFQWMIFVKLCDGAFTKISQTSWKFFFK